MKAATLRSSRRNDAVLLLSILFTLLILAATTASAATRLALTRNGGADRHTEYKGVVVLAIDPGLENARVRVEVDGQRVADNLLSPWHVTVDFGPTPIQHRITVIATGTRGRTVRWTETINRGNLPLTLKVKAVDPGARLFEAETTSPKEDPIDKVQVWDGGRLALTLTEPPYRFQATQSMIDGGIVQVSARTAAGEEAADFWSPAGNVVSEEMQVRTVPIFVSVVDRDGKTLDDVDRSQFRVIDNETEARIVEFGKAFDQPISIALLLDSSGSMLYSMKHAARAAKDFVERAIKDGDRCSVTAVQDVPRRRQSLTADRAAVAAALEAIRPAGKTAIIDALASAIRELRDEKNRRAIVVMTDGADTASNYTWDEVNRMAREAAIPIYFIAYEGDSEETVEALDRMRFLAAETGGFVATATQQNLMARYEAIERDLRAQFAIRYQITDFARSNQYRRVRVVLDSPRMTARTIRGYFTP